MDVRALNKTYKRVAKLIDSILYFLNCEYSSENPIGVWVGKQIIFLIHQDILLMVVFTQTNRYRQSIYKYTQHIEM